MLFLILGTPVSRQRQRTGQRTGSESGGERVDAVCDDEACEKTALAPLSLKRSVSSAGARALALLIQMKSAES
jgi:hypothetical protein